MDAFSIELNNLLVDTFRSILKVEEHILRSSGRVDLTISELHMIESVGKNHNSGKTISDIAEDLGITLPSVTIAIGKLMKKGYVQKTKSDTDGRTVIVTLTKLGLKMDAAHRYFHETMVRAVSKGLSEEEKASMLKGIVKLNAFFEKKLLPSEE